MADILVKAKRFTGTYSHLNGSRRIKVTRRAFLRATLTLGFQRFGDFAGAGINLWSHRMGCALSALSYLKTSGDDLMICESRQHLDMSEKGAQSYWHGMVFAKLVAERILEVPWLAHVDDMIAKGYIQTSQASNERGDMVGICKQRRWHVIEAKGRSNPYSSAFVKSAKDQAACVKTVKGIAPATTSACIASMWKSPITVLLDDPAPVGMAHWSFDDETFWEYYYGGIAAYIRKHASKSFRNDKYDDYSFASLVPTLGIFPVGEHSRFPATRAMIGLPKEIIENPRNGPGVARMKDTAGDSEASGDGIALVGNFGYWDEGEQTK